MNIKYKITIVKFFPWVFVHNPFELFSIDKEKFYDNRG